MDWRNSASVIAQDSCCITRNKCRAARRSNKVQWRSWSGASGAAALRSTQSKWWQDEHFTFEKVFDFLLSTHFKLTREIKCNSASVVVFFLKILISVRNGRCYCLFRAPEILATPLLHWNQVATVRFGDVTQSNHSATKTTIDVQTELLVGEWPSMSERS